MKNGKKEVAVIGAGLGGMAAALCCASAGYRVSLFEKNERIGGKLNIMHKGDYTFDTGPSLLTLPHIFRSLFGRAGKNFDDYVEIAPLSVHWRNFFEDGSVFDFLADQAETERELTKIDPCASGRLRRFLSYSRRQYAIVDKKYFMEGLDTVGSIISRYNAFSLIAKFDVFRTMGGSIRRFFSDSRIRSAFEYFAKYVGSSPYKAPGFLNLLPWVQFHYGLWYVKGGMYNLARGIERALKEAGVAIHTDHEVARIVKNGNCVGGIVFENGRRISADVIVSNMEVTPAYAELLGEEASFLRRFEKFEPSCSGVVLHLGTNKIFPSLAHHNFFFSRDPRRSYKAVFDDYTIPDDPTLYVVAPCRTDPGQAPAGCDNIKILPQFPHLGVKRFSEGDIADFRDRILAKLERMGLTGLRESIVAEDLWTPYDLERRYRSNKGSIYGVVCDRTKNFALKASKRSSRYKNLFFVGGSVNPGGGMPMVVLGGMKAADLVCKAFP